MGDDAGDAQRGRDDGGVPAESSAGLRLGANVRVGADWARAVNAVRWVTPPEVTVSVYLRPC